MPHRRVEKQIIGTSLISIENLIVDTGEGLIPEDCPHQISGAKWSVNKADQGSSPFFRRIDLCAIKIDGNIGEKTSLLLLIDFLNQSHPTG